MPSGQLESLQSELNSIYAKLKPLYRDPVANASEISSLNAKAAELSAQIGQLRDAVKKSEGMEYSNSRGIFVKNQNDKNNNLGISDSTSPLKDDITKNQWYNIEQVTALTGKPVAYGTDSFISMVQSGNNAFVYLKKPDGVLYNGNHFVSIMVLGKTVTYIDSNGLPMAAEDRDALSARGYDVVYRNFDGNEISEKYALSHQNELYRCQFNNYDCGMYSSEIVSALLRSSSDTEIASSLNRIKNIDSHDARQSHTNLLDLRISINQAHQAAELISSIRSTTPQPEQPSMTYVERVSLKSSSERIAAPAA